MTQIFSQIVIKGKVIEDNCEELIGVNIFDNHDNLIGETDYNGNFQIELPKDSCKLVFAYVGFEPAKIEITESCNYIEIILLPASSYDFMTSRKIDRLRKKEFDKLPKIHSQAVEKGVFINPNICYKRQFEKIMPRLDEIKKKRKLIENDIKITFKELSTGDTIRIPFSFQKGKENEPYRLQMYSSMTNIINFEFVIQCIINRKFGNKNGKNLTVKVIDINEIGNNSAILNNKLMKVGQEFEINMTIYKIIMKKRTSP